jgi:tRNA G18 (ribose-2'-O)-methylase SpoU
MISISSADDARLDPFRNIKGQSARIDGTFVAESELVLDRLFESAITVRSVLITPARAARLDDLLRTYVSKSSMANAATEVFVASQNIIDSVVGYPLHRGVIAVAERPELPPVSSLLERASTLLVLEDVMDPENVGTIFRHAAGFGVHAVLLHGHSGDPLYRKTIRTSMGWTLGIPYARTTTGVPIVALLQAAGFVTLALTPERSAKTLSAVMAQLGPQAKIAFLLGAEGPGLPATTLDAVDHRVRIPLADGVDSLNVATAAAIALYGLTTAQPQRLQPIFASH